MNALRLIIASVLAALAFPLLAGAGVVRTLDGKTYEGDILLSADGTLAVQRKKEPLVNVDLANLLEADFKADTSTAHRPIVVEDSLPDGWKTADVGRAALPGSARCVDGDFYIKGAGASINNHNESLYYVYRQLSGDGQIVLHVRDFQAGNTQGTLGLMIRDDLQPLARAAMLILHGAKGLRYMTRTEHNRDFSAVAQVNRMEAPIWLMLQRRGKTLIASRSADGSHWDAIGRTDLPLGPNVLIGISLSSGDPNALASAICENITVGPLNDHPTPPVPDVASYTKSVALISGTVIGDATLVSLSDQAVKFHDPQNHVLNVPMSEVARLSFMPLSPAMLAKIPDHTPGVLKPSGDFIEGDFAGLDAHHVKLSSVLFGLENLSIGDEAAVLVLRDAEPAPSAMIVRTANGSVYLAKSLHLDHDGVILDELTLGSVHVPAKDLVDIKAGSLRLQWLDALKPAAVDAPDGLSPANAWIAGGLLVGRPLALAGAPCDHALCLQSGASLLWRLDGPYKLLIFRCGVPDAVLPSISAQLIVSADSKEILRTPLRTSLDDPQTFSLSIAGAKTLSLRVQSDAPMFCPLVCAEAQLVK